MLRGKHDEWVVKGKLSQGLMSSSVDGTTEPLPDSSYNAQYQLLRFLECNVTASNIGF